MFGWVSRKISNAVVWFIERPLRKYQPFSVVESERLQHCLEPGDVLLIEGNQRISSIIKYLTQSTWSHAAIFVGDQLSEDGDNNPPTLVEARAKDGVIAVPLSKFAQFNTRICRPIGLSDEDRAQVVQFAVDSLGKKYDLRNVVDLFRYLIPHPPVPVRFRRRMLALGSGDPTRAICSTLIAQAFQTVRYPILPDVEAVDGTQYTKKEVLHIRHYSLFAPRDFDLSPYFAVVKPTIESGFDYKEIVWGDRQRHEQNRQDA